MTSSDAPGDGVVPALRNLGTVKLLPHSNVTDTTGRYKTLCALQPAR